jgi:hypothetical protein
VKRDEKWSRVLLGFQLLVNACHVLIHHFAPSLLWTGGHRPTALSEFLIYAGGLSCIAFVGIVGGQLQREQKSEDSRFPDSGRGSGGRVFLIAVSFVAEGVTQYLVQ